MSDDTIDLPADWQSLLDYYIKLNPRVKAPNPVQRDGYWSGIAGRALNSFVSFDVLRVKLENEVLIEEERRDWLFSSECPGVSLVELAADSSLHIDNTAWSEPSSPPPSTWSAPVPHYDHGWLNSIRKD